MDLFDRQASQLIYAKASRERTGLKLFAFFKFNKCDHLFTLKECWRDRENKELYLEIIFAKHVSAGLS